MTLQITEDRLQELLEAASERGAIKALQMVGRSTKRRWYTAAEAVQLLGCSRSTLTRYEKEGIIRTNGQTYGLKRYAADDITKIKG